MAAPVDDEVIYEVECRLDPSIVAEFDAWLPDHVRQVCACVGFSGAEIQVPAQDEDDAVVRRTQYRLENAAALERYLAEDAPRMRADGAARFGDKVHYTRHILRPAVAEPPVADAPIACQNCGSDVTGHYCAECGQSAHIHVMAIGDVIHDFVHSVLHLDSRVWRTLRSLVLKPGELTREFIAGRRARYLPPFRLYLVISIAFFALSAVLPDARILRVNEAGQTVVAPVELELPGGGDDSAKRDAEAAAAREVLEELSADPDMPGIVRDIAARRQPEEIGKPGDLSVSLGWPRLDRLLEEAGRKVEEDGGKRLGEVFLANAPKLMFLFLPLMAAVALLFYWKPRRLYAEHLVLFLHVHAFLFLWLAINLIIRSVASLEVPLVGLLGFASFALLLYVPWYVFRAMRVVYGNGRALTAVKFVAQAGIYFVLLGATLLVGIVYSMLSL